MHVNSHSVLCFGAHATRTFANRWGVNRPQAGTTTSKGIVNPGETSWHGWLPGLSPRTLGTPWAVASSDLASTCLENVLGSYPISASSAWQPFWNQDDVEDMVDDVPDDPNIWTDGSREPIPHLDFEIAGAGAFVHSLLSFLIVVIGVMLMTLMLHMRVVPISFRVSLVPSSRFRELSIGASFLPCRLILAFILVLII